MRQENIQEKIENKNEQLDCSKWTNYIQEVSNLIFKKQDNYSEEENIDIPVKKKTKISKPKAKLKPDLTSSTSSIILEPIQENTVNGWSKYVEEESE